MGFNIKNIVHNLFGEKESDIENETLIQLKKAVDVSVDKLRFIDESKQQLITAFDTFNDHSAVELEKACEVEDKQAIQRRIDRHQENFLRESREVVREKVTIKKAIDHNLTTLMNTISPNDCDFMMYKALQTGEAIQQDYFSDLNFDCDTSQMTFRQITSLLSKAIDLGALDRGDNDVILSEEQYNNTALTLAKAVESNALSPDDDRLIKATRNLANLTPVRTQIVTRDGRVYTKTVYHKREEKTGVKAQNYTTQLDFESRMKRGDKINVHFKGWSTGREYTAPKLEIISIGTKSITAKFTEKFKPPGGRGNYTYGPSGVATDEQGQTIEIPRVASDKWNQKERFEEWIDPAIERRRRREAEVTQREKTAADRARLLKTHTIEGGDVDETNAQDAQTEELTHSDQIQNGDVVQFKQGGTTVRGVVYSVWRQDGGKARLTVTLDGNRNSYKQIPATRGGPVEKVITGQTTSVSSDSDGPPTVKNPTEMNLAMVKSMARVAGVKVGGMSKEEVLSMTQDQYDASWASWARSFNTEFPNFDMPAMLKGVVKEAKSVGVQRITLKISKNPGGGLSIIGSGSGGFILKRDLVPAQGSGANQGSKVYHRHFEVGRSLMGKGLGKKIFRHLNKQYRRAGITQLTVGANISSGAYAWGRYGFTSTRSQARSFANAIHGRIGEQISYEGPDGNIVNYRITQDDGDKMKAVVEAFYQNNPHSTRFPMNDICQVNGSKAAKAYLNGRSWDGHLDLTDLNQRDQFESYMRY